MTFNSAQPGMWIGSILSRDTPNEITSLLHIKEKNANEVVCDRIIFFKAGEARLMLRRKEVLKVNQLGLEEPLNNFPEQDKIEIIKELFILEQI